MQLTFYGVRGSIPAPGPEYIKFGGNTACVHIRTNDGTDLILDAGTGIKKLGQKLLVETGDIHILLTHNHWDHIQGFPFFTPIYQPERNIFITPGMISYDEQDAILKQMTGSYFPVHYQSLQSNIVINAPPDGRNIWYIGDIKIQRKSMNHPGSGSAYIIEADGAKIAYITDNELYPPYRKETDFLEWVNFAVDADLLIHDAQYVVADMPAKSGWGHSVAEEAVKLALACRAKRLALYSHDHTRTDDDISAIESHCQEVIAIAEAELQVFAAAEGQKFDFHHKE